MSIQRYSMFVMGGSAESQTDDNGDWVDYSEHVSSHMLDEAKERELFESLWPIPTDCIWCGNGYAATEYGAFAANDYAQRWIGWLACAKSRATR